MIVTNQNAKGETVLQILKLQIKDQLQLHLA